MQLLFKHPQIPYIIYFFIGLNLVYLIGHFFYNYIYKTKQKNSFEIFTKLTFGAITIILISSLIWTKGNTIFIGLLIPIFFLIRGNNLNVNFELPSLKQIGYLNFIATPIVLIQLLLYSKWGDWTLLPIDINNQVEISFFLNQGFESKYAALNSLDPNYAPTKNPYHYSENWLTTFFHTIFSSTYLGYTMMYVVYPILFTILLSGILYIIKPLKLNSFIAIIFSILLLFLGPIDSGFTRKLFDSGNLLSSNTIIFENVGFFFNTLPFSYHGQKHMPFYILACWIIIMAMKSKDKKLLYLLGFAPIINIGLVPSIVGGVGLLTLYKIWKLKNFKEPFINIIPLILTTIFLLVFYKINGGYDTGNQTLLNTFNTDLNVKGEILKIAYKLGYGLIFICLIYSLYVFLYNPKKQIELSKTLSLLIFFLVLSGLITRIIFEGFNTPQFLSYILPLVNLYLIYVLCSSYNNQIKNKIILILITVICINNICQTYFHTTTRREISISKIHNKDFLKKVDLLLAKNPNPKFGYFLSDVDFKTIPPGFWYGYYPCEFLLTKDCFQFYSLNFPNYHYPNNSQQSNNYSPNHLRYIFPHTMNKNEYLSSISKFIKKYRIEYVLAKQKTTLPSSLSKTITDSIVDPKTGDRIFLIKY
jgi:hypothetical protein